jgi:hypothetical protein
VFSLPCAETIRKPASAKAATMRAARASGSPRAVSLIVFAIIRSTAALSPFGIPLSLLWPHALTPPRDLRCPWHRALRDERSRPHIGAMNLDLSDEETAALTRELHNIVENDRYPFSPRNRTLRGMLAKLRPEPVREP